MIKVKKRRARKMFFPFLQAICITVAVLTQYFVMAAFCWMLVEGIYFYLLIVKVYNISNRLIVYHVMAWGIVLQSIMTFIIVSADLPYFESVYCWYNLTPNFTNPLSLCVKVFPSLWSALLSALRLEKEGFKATPAINSKKQSLRQFYLLFCFLSMIGLVYLCFGFPF